MKAIRRAAVLALLCAAVLAATGAPAWAQGRLAASDPADGTALDRAPSEVDFTFTATPDAGSSHAAAATAAGAAVTSGPLRQHGRTGLRLPVTITAAGDYLVAYHVEFADGTDVTGLLRFSVGTGVPPAPAGAAAQRAEAQVAAAHSHGVDPLSATLLLADGVVLVAVVVLLRRRKRPDLTSV